MDERAKPSTSATVIALLLVYIFWGGTYLGIKLATETIPPFFMAGTRFLFSGLILYVYARLKGAPRPSAQNILAGFGVAGLLLVLGNGSVTFASRFVPSNITAIVIATVPMWMILLNWAFISKKPPSIGVVIGVFVGLFGIAILVLGANAGPTPMISPLGIAITLFAAISWAGGSLYSRYAKLPEDTVLSIALQMLCASVLFAALSIFLAEYREFSFADVSASSLIGMLYLIFFGSIVGYSAYIWLMKYVEPSLVSTYAFVNPVIAAIAGWIILDEKLASSALYGSIIIVIAVVIITFSQSRSSKI